MSDGSGNAPKAGSWWTRPSLSPLQLLGCFGVIALVVLVVGGIVLYAALVNAGAQ